MIRRPVALLAVLAAACNEPLPALGGVEAAPTCQASDEAFVLQALPWLQGRRPSGIRELRLLADMIRELDRHGADGRAMLARGLARGPRHARRWSDFLVDHLQIDRAGHRFRPNCHATRALPDDGGELAAWIRDHDADEPVPGQPQWTFADLLASSLALDDLSPLMRASLLVRASQPIDGNNVSPSELESARRREFTTSFAASHLGRNLECLVCHNSEGSPTDRTDSAEDRFWPLDLPFERAVFAAPTGRPEVEVEAVFRVSGAVDGPLRPWGSAACSTFQPDHTGDLLGDPAYLAGPLPTGATVLDLDPHLRAGWGSLREIGWTGLDPEDLDPDVALAAMTAAHLADAVWRELGGQPLTLAHGFPRDQAQRDILAALTQEFVDTGFSLRALVVAAATHPQLALDLPAACDARGVIPSPVLAPFAVHALEPSARGDSLGDLLHRHGTFVLLGMAAESMGWTAPPAGAGPYGLANETLLLDLGARVSGAQPADEGLDLVALLAYEAAVGAGVDPRWAGELTDPVWPDGDLVDVLLATANADGSSRIEDLVVALKDRLHTAPTLDSGERNAITAVLGAPWTASVADVDPITLESGLRRVAGALLRAPQFMLAGAVELPASGAPTPRLVVPGTDTASLCKALAPMILGDAWRWRCGPDGLEQLTPRP